MWSVSAAGAASCDALAYCCDALLWVWLVGQWLVVCCDRAWWQSGQ